MKILYVTTVVRTMNFFSEHIKMLIKEGHTVEIATNCDNNKVPEYCDNLGLKVHNIPFSRSPLDKSNLIAYKKLKEVIENEDYDIVHTHTPNASVCVRLACRKLRKKGLKVIYTAHGFHFYKGAPLKNWLLYFPVEWLCSFWTDTLITINKEDFEFAKKHLHAKNTEYVHGVGINLNTFSKNQIDVSKKREELGLPSDATVLISVGELNNNKNHKTVIKAIKGMNVYYVIVGSGNKEKSLQELIDSQKMSEKIKLLGYRNDIKELFSISDIFVFPSYREGLPVSLMEAMAYGLPCVVSDIRGNRDLIDNTKGGFCCIPNDVQNFKVAIDKLCRDEILCREYANYNKEKVAGFSIQKVLEKMSIIYKL